MDGFVLGLLPFFLQLNLLPCLYAVLMKAHYCLLISLKIYIVLVREYRVIANIKLQVEPLMKDLIHFLREADDDQVLEKRLLALLTPNEVSEMQRRLQIFALLKEGKPQRDIAKQLGVGIATVTRGSRALKELESK